MKILHCSDLHLGAKTENVSRIEEQRETIARIVGICEEQQIDIVLVAGDVFHTATPSAEAEDLFYGFLEKLTKDNNRVVCVVAGNHDDPNRLLACLPLARRHNIVIASDLSQIATYDKIGDVCIVSTDRGFVKVEKSGEKVCIGLLPYPIESRITPSLDGVVDTEGMTYQQKVSAWANIACKNFEKDAFNVLVSHLYLIGGKEPCETESNLFRRVKLGDSLAVPAEVFPKCDYVALGHLHTTHKVEIANSNVYYSGATTKLRWFDGAPRVLVLETKSKKVEEIELFARDIMKLGVRENDLFTSLDKIDSNCLVYLEILDAKSLAATTIKEIRTKYPNVLSIKFLSTNTLNETQKNVKSLSPKDLFIEFFKQKRGELPSEDLVETFLTILEDTNETQES